LISSLTITLEVNCCDRNPKSNRAIEHLGEASSPVNQAIINIPLDVSCSIETL
ncbi:unnamed protein product, partial [Rotaria sp. Silwood2]